ncbi:MAG: hypothetical protein LQ343_007312 [Gyalolechia ehrenbergii]|nr:MAG: hypothetical protein LQ343_007312 [Gyalolechia ehrenbergii]
MATYGKKKRAIFPGFSGFQDDDQPSKKPSNRAAYTQLSTEQFNSKRSVQHDTADDKDIDELASSSLLDAPDRESDAASTRNNSLRSSQSLQPSAKPLPPLPFKARPKETIKNETRRPVLGPKSTNLSLANKKTKLPAKPQISPPILISPSTDPFAGQVGTDWAPAADTSYSEQRIITLEQQADAQQAETREKEKKLAAIEASVRPSPLQRGISAFTTAKRAITSRLESPRIKLGRTRNLLNRTLSGPEYGSIEKVSGTSSTTHRPLPVYESMRTRRETPEPHEERDPFSDIMETNEAWSEFEIHLDRPRGKRRSPRQHSMSHTPPTDVEHSLASEKPFAQTKPTFDFSNTISGLRQHPDPEFFSSSPVGFSTPRVRLEPIHDANGKKRLSAVLMRNPSTMDFSYEQDMTDDEADLLIPNENDAEHGSSVKRKSATEDLRAHTYKRAKTDSATSAETTILAKGFDQLGAGDVQVMPGVEVAPGDETPMHDASKTNSFGIFNMGKGKATGTRTEDPIEVSSIRRHSRRTSSSLSRPTSVLFSRESRARVPLLQSHKDDEMEVDELQL